MERCTRCGFTSCFRLHWLCCVLICTNLHFSNIHADLFFQENDSHTLTMGVLLKMCHLKIKCDFREFKIWYSNITKLLSRLINFLLYIIKIVTTLKYFSYASQSSSLVWTCPDIFFLSLFYPLESACSSKVSSKVLTSFSDIFPSTTKDEEVITEQLKPISAALVRLEFM